MLFPVVGWTREGRARVDGVDYPLSLHGFAWNSLFHVAERRDDFFAPCAGRRRCHPGALSFRLPARSRIRLSPGRLDNALIVTNSGDSPLPYACGLHPAFRWPLAGSTAEHAILFDADERPEVPVIAPGGLFSNERRPVPLTGRRLPLSQDLLAREALCFLHANSQSLAFDNGAGARLHVALEDFPHIAFWSLPPAPYLCIEPWTGHGDPVGFAGDLREKPRCGCWRRAKTARHAAVFSFEQDGF